MINTVQIPHWVVQIGIYAGMIGGVGFVLLCLSFIFHKKKMPTLSTFCNWTGLICGALCVTGRVIQDMYS